MKKEFGWTSIYFCGAAFGVAAAVQEENIMNSPLYSALFMVALYAVSGVLLFAGVAMIGQSVEEHFIEGAETKGGRIFKAILSLVVWCFIVLLIAGIFGRDQTASELHF